MTNVTEPTRPLRELKVGDVTPLPRPKLSIRPARGDDSARSPRGVFTNGRNGK